MTILLDSSAYISLFNGDKKTRDIVTDATAIFMSPAVIGELMYGHLKGSKHTHNNRMLLDFLAEPRVSIYDIDKDIARTYAELKLDQERLGKNLAINDLWIASTAIHLGARLVTSDSDFLRIDHEGLSISYLG